ncbi:MAG TPA: hypothetical protein VFY65_16055, partial [Longimicrobium sp.]|nr:hypothetical protein [Longimicrobium sp.]
VNPTEKVIRGIVMHEGDRLLRIIREVGRELLRNDKQVRDGLKRIVQQRMAGHGQDPDDPIQVGHGKGFLAGAADIARVDLPPGKKGKKMTYPKGRLRRPGSVEYLEVGKRGSGDVVTERQTYTSGAGHIRTEGVGKYHEIIPQIAAIAKVTKTDDARVAVALQKYVQTGVLEKGYAAHARTFHALARLMLSVEPGRGSAIVVTGPALVRIVGAGQLDAEKGFLKVNPAAPVGAVRAMAGVSEKLGMAPERIYTGYAKQDRVKKMMKSELEVIVQMLLLELQVKKPAFRTEKQLETLIRKEFKDYVMERTLGLFTGKLK